MKQFFLLGYTFLFLTWSYAAAGNVDKLNAAIIDQNVVCSDFTCPHSFSNGDRKDNRITKNSDGSISSIRLGNKEIRFIYDATILTGATIAGRTFGIESFVYNAQPALVLKDTTGAYVGLLSLSDTRDLHKTELIELAKNVKASLYSFEQLSQFVDLSASLAQLKRGKTYSWLDQNADKLAKAGPPMECDLRLVQCENEAQDDDALCDDLFPDLAMVVPPLLSGYIACKAASFTKWMVCIASC